MLEHFNQLSVEAKFIAVIFVIAIVIVILKKVFFNFYNKSVVKLEKYLVPIIDEAVIRSAKYLNSISGQEKMDLAVKYVQEKSKTLPWYLQFIFINFDKKHLVDSIERAYQVYKQNMNSKVPDEIIDIKGNETKKK